MHALNQYLSESLKQLRQQRGWSLERAGKETGVSKAMLGQIERGESSPTIATLWKIATGFDTSLTALLEPSPVEDQGALVRSADKLRHQPAQESMLVASLFPYDERFKFELMELTLAPGYEQVSSPHATDVIEHVVVITGNIELLIHGEWQAFVAGDAVRFAADKPHGYRNVSNAPVVIHNLIHYPQKNAKTE